MKRSGSLFLVGLVTVVALAACSTNKSTESGHSLSSTAIKSSKMEEPIASSSAVKTLKESTVTYLSDQEIDTLQTLGDVKISFKALTDAYVTDFDQLIAQLPSEGQKTLIPFRDELKQMLDEQQEMLETQFASLGDDSTQIPDETREMIVSTLKTTRDQLKQAMTTAREQAQDVLQ